MRTVTCRTHGDSQAVFVCSHLVETLHDGLPQVRIKGADDEAWCLACDDLVSAEGGEWTDELMDRVGVAIICRQCSSAVESTIGLES